MPSVRVGFVGAGKMATALAKGFVDSRRVSADDIAASDPQPEACKHFAVATGCRVAETNRDAVAGADVVFLAVKPQHVAAALAEMRECVGQRHLVVSIAAGISLEAIDRGLDSRSRLVRVMPNTPCLIGQGASAYALGPRAGDADGELVRDLLESVGLAFRVEESLLDAVTGLSGSGPAFACVVIEALADGGVQMGLPRQIALALAAQTVRGTGQMVLDSGKHPAQLKDEVASPGGTTIAGLAALEAGGCRAALIQAVAAATRRSEELRRLV